SGHRRCDVEVRDAAARELEAPYSGVPVESAVRRQVLVGVPERAVVARVDGHARVVAPALAQVAVTRVNDVLELRARTRDDGAFALAHDAEVVGRQPASVPDTRVRAANCAAVVHRHVLSLVTRE